MSPHYATIEARQIARLPGSSEGGQQLDGVTLRTLIETTPTGIVVVDAEGIVRLANQAAVRIFGGRLTSNIFRPRHEDYTLLRPDGSKFPRHDLPLARCLERGESSEGVEILVRYADGTERLVLAAANPERDHLGRVTGAVAVYQDITDRKQVEASLRETQESLAEAQRIAHIGNWDWNRHTGRIHWSDELYRIAGLTPGRVVLTLRAFLALVHPDDRDAVERHFADALLGKRPFHVTHRIVRPDGTIRVVECQAEVTFDEEGKPVRMVGTAQDVTERARMAEERDRLLDEVSRQRARLEAIVEMAPAGILFVGVARGAVIANREASRIFGRTVDGKEVSEQCLNAVRLPDGGPVRRDDLPPVRALRGDSADATDLLVVQPGGDTVPVRWSAVPIRGAHGEIVGAVSLIHDVTDVQQLEHLRQEWTAMVAHDLRQPVAVVNLAAQLLAKQEAVAPSVRRWVEDIVTSSHRLDQMVSDLLDGYRIESSRLKLRVEQVDVAKLVATIVARLARAYPDRSIRLISREPIPSSELDPGRLEQVLTNLVSNAAKYGYPSTDVLVELAAREDTLELAVTNQGPGIRPDDLPHIFDRFYRTPGAEASRQEGFGLGLYVAKGIVEAHGGRIGVESTPGQSTRFRVSLPVR
jgi:PAS domain S-box-containing protein